MEKKILIIDGDAASRNYLKVMLGDDRFVVDLAASGKEGLITAWKNRPDIIVVDPDLPDMPGLELISRLRQDRRTSFANIIALGGPCDQQTMDTLLQAGFNEYLVKSNQAIEDLIAILSGTPKQRIEKRHGRIMAFLSAKGGTGTSSLCANIAMCVGKKLKGSRVVVVDLVLPVGSIANIVGYTGKINLVTLAQEREGNITAEVVKENLPKLAAWNFSLLAGSPDPESANQLAVGRIPEILTALQDTFDFVFIDLGRSLSRISMPILIQADVLALVTNNDLSTITLTHTIWDYLQQQGVNPQRIYPLLNRAVGLEGLTKSEVEDKLGFQIRLTVPYMGGNFTVANNRHEPVISKFPSDSAALVIEQISKQMVELSKLVRENRVLEAKRDN
jgi:pilus assembly protein CpaE